MIHLTQSRIQVKPEVSIDEWGDRRLPRGPPTGYLPDDIQMSTMDTALAPTNKGYKLLMKMGWAAGSGLGRDGKGVCMEAKHCYAPYME